MSSQLDSLKRFVGERAPTENGGGDARRVVVVGSGKGGVGTSVVAALLAMTASEAGANVLLVDANDGSPALHFLLGVEPAHVLSDLRGGGVAPAQLVMHVSASLALLPGGTRDDAALTPAERRALFRRVAGLYASYDLVIVDGGSRLDSVLSVCDGGAGRLLAVTTSDRIAVAATYALIKATGARHTELTTEVLLNGCEERAIVQGYEMIQAAAEQFLERTVALAGVVPHDASLRAALGEGMPIGDAAAGSPVAIVIHEMAMRLLDEMTELHEAQMNAVGNTGNNAAISSDSSVRPRAGDAARSSHPRS